MTTEPKPVPPMPVEPTTTGGPSLDVPNGYTFHNANDLQTIRDLASRLTASQALVEELAGEMRRYLPILECAESDPQTWIALSEGTGMATVNGYRAALSHYKEATR